MPTHLKINFNNENRKLYFKSFYYIFCSIYNNKNTCDINKLNIIIIKIEDTIIINDENLNKKILLKNGERLVDPKEFIKSAYLFSFEKEVLEKLLKSENKLKAQIKLIYHIKFEKDEDDNFHIYFILLISNLRGIEL